MSFIARRSKARGRGYGGGGKLRPAQGCWDDLMDELDCLHLTVFDKLHHFYNNIGLNSHCRFKHNNSNTFATYHFLKCYFFSRSLAPEMPDSSGGLALTRYNSTQAQHQLKPISCSSILIASHQPPRAPAAVPLPSRQLTT